jgi:hypothetical protein
MSISEKIGNVRSSVVGTFWIGNLDMAISALLDPIIVSIADYEFGSSEIILPVPGCQSTVEWTVDRGNERMSK